MLIGFIAAILAVVIALVAYITVASIDPEAEEADDAALGLLVMVGTIACVTLLLLIISFILIIVGIVNFNQGKNEFPGKHPGSVTAGTIFFILWLIMFFGSIVAPFMLFSFSGDVEEVWDNIRNTIIITAVLSFLSILFMGLMYVFLVKDIGLPADVKILWIGFFLFIISGIISVALAFLLLPGDVGDLSSSELQTLSSGADAVRGFGGVAQIIGFILFFIAYKHTLTGLQTGQIQPGGMPPR
jgi:hypothetical protein